jgi:hypothetical protein
MTKDNAAACMPVKQRLSVLALGWTLLLLATAAFLGAEDLRTTFNSDIYYLPVLVKDVLHMGGSLAEWRLPPAPYFFPDLPLFLAARFVTGSAIAGLALAGASHYIIFIGGWFALAGRFARNENSRFASQTAVLALGILGMVLGSLRYVAYASTQITVHFGVMAVAPWVILLADIFLSGEKRRNRALAGVTLFFVTGALTASDMLSVTQILMPSLCAMLLLAITAKASWKTISIAWLSMGSGAAVGANMLRWFGKASLDY